MNAVPPLYQWGPESYYFVVMLLDLYFRYRIVHWFYSPQDLAWSGLRPLAKQNISYRTWWYHTFQWFRALLPNCGELDAASGFLPSSHFWENYRPRAHTIRRAWNCKGKSKWVWFRCFVLGKCSVGAVEVDAWILLATSDAKGEWRTPSQVLLIITCSSSVTSLPPEGVKQGRAEFSPRCNLSRQSWSLLSPGPPEDGDFRLLRCPC